MTLRRAHGRGRNALVRIETLPADELPIGEPAHSDDESRAASEERGRFGRGNKRSVLGGRAHAGQSRLAARLGLSTLDDGAALRPYMRSATTFRRVQCAELARTVGGGVCGPGPSSMVASAALALAWSRYLSDRAALTGDPDLASRAVRLADSSRTMLLTAHELCAREAQARASRETSEERMARVRRSIIGDP